MRMRGVHSPFSKQKTLNARLPTIGTTGPKDIPASRSPLIVKKDSVIYERYSRILR